MAVAHWALAAQRHERATGWPWPRPAAWRRRLREDVRGVAELFAVVRCFTRDYERRAAVLVLIGLAIVAWDLAVPMVGARVIDAMAADRPFQEVALLILGLSALVWIPHGNLLPYLLDVFDLRRFGVRLHGHVAVRSLQLALANPENRRRLERGELTRGEAQPILVEDRENVGQLALAVVREIPAAVRGLGVLCLLAYMVPPFVPLLLLGAAVDLAITYRMGARLAPHFQARQDAENAQRRLENELLADHFRADLPPAEVERIVARYDAAVGERVAREIAAEVPARTYKLKRDLVFNATNISSWLVGAWYVVVGDNPIGTFLFFVAWSSRANELFAAIMNVQQETMRARRAVQRLAALTGLGRAA
jgi:ABC-type multidrug transport system fused ATPase/permease subunit